MPVDQISALERFLTYGPIGLAALMLVLVIIALTLSELSETRLRTHSQKITSAASAIAERKTLGHLSYLVATRRQSLSLPNMISIRLRRLYRRLSYRTAVLRCFRPGIQARIPLSFNASLNQSAS